MIWACQAVLWLMVDTQNNHEYVSDCRERLNVVFLRRTHMSMCRICTGFWFLKSDGAHSLCSTSRLRVRNMRWIFYHLFTHRNKDTRQSRVRPPHKYMPKCFFCEFTSKCIKIPFSIIWNCTFLNYSLQGIEAPRSFKFFISAQLQTVDLVKGTQFWGVGIAAGWSWQDFSVSRHLSLLHYSKAKEQIQVN